MTLSDLAGRLNKSASTISKYESGSLLISMDDLIEICRILRMDLYSVLPETAADAVSPDYSRYSKHFTEHLYLYWYNGEKGIIQKAVTENRNSMMKTVMYYDFTDYLNHYRCNYNYSGDLYYSDTDIIGVFRNLDPPFDMMTLRLPFMSGSGKPSIGIITCISSYYQSVAMKVVGSAKPIHDERYLTDTLKLSAEELKSIKKTNFFTIR